MASMKAMPLKSTARLAVAPDIAIASSLTRPPRSLVPVARDDEERVVGRDRKAHHRRHVEDVRRQVERLADQRRRAPSAMTIEKTAITSGTTAATTAPKTSTRITSAAGMPK